MSAEVEATASKTLPAGPYVGLRPFDRSERDIFFGRGRDAELLCNQVFSARLTVLYGPSGIGKSSILRTLVIPRLEVQEACGIYFDAWRGGDPVATLKEALIREATAVGIPLPGAGAPNLIDLIRLLISADGRTVVLILDQFEEYLTSHADRLDPLKSELAELVRAPGLDVRLVLSLREEHLASLEPFRSDFLNLFQSTCRLDHISADDALKAIEGPANLFGVEVESGLLDALIADLSASASKTTASQGAALDLPMLQLICTELWRSRRDPKALTLSQYQELGRRQGIQAGYVRRMMPTRWRAKVLTAELMRHLAPPDGHKAPHSASHLADLTQRPQARVQAELERLSGQDVRVLRTRQYETSVLYELRHDSFIRVIAPWRDEILNRQRRARRIGRAASILVGIVTVAWVVMLWRDHADLEANTDAIFEDPQLLWAQKFDHVANYLLWRRQGTERLQLLKKHLQEKKESLPEDYGVTRSGLEFVTLPRAVRDWPLTLHYSSARELDEYVFTRTWRDVARFLSEEWGLPVPAALQMDREDTFPKALVRVTGPGIEPLEFSLPTYERDAFFDAENLSTPGREFLELFRDDWRPLPEVQYGGPWWVVPRWSLPAWKVSGVQAVDGSGLVALLLYQELMRNPDRLLSPQVVEYLLSEAANSHPATVAEARDIRGARLRGDLSEVVKHSRALTDLWLILDALTKFPEGDSADIAAEVVADLDAAAPVAPMILSGPRASARQKQSAQVSGPKATAGLHRAFDDSLRFRPKERPEVRYYLGSGLDQEWIGPDGLYKDEFYEVLWLIQDNVARKYGVSMPWPQVFRGSADPSLAPDEFRIELLSQDNVLPHIEIPKTEDVDAKQVFARALQFQAESYRARFITTELAQDELSGLPKNVRAWLEARYSLTDLKLLLRSVTAPGEEELLARVAALDTTQSPSTPVDMPSEHTVRDPGMLLASLVFWTAIDDPHSLDAMTERLRATQQPRFRAGATSGGSEEVIALVSEGIKALSLGAVEQASGAFVRAIMRDRAAAESAFLLLHFAEYRNALVNRLVDSCRPFARPNLGESERLSLEDILTEGDVDKTLGEAKTRQLRICLVAALPRHYVATRRSLLADLLLRYDDLAEMSPRDAARLGVEIVRTFDPLSDDKAMTQRASQLLASALARLEPADARNVIDDVIGVCDAMGPDRWCWQLLAAVEKAGRNPWATIATAWAFASKRTGDRADLDTALAMVDRATRRVGMDEVPPEDRIDLRDWTKLTRAVALIGLMSLGDKSAAAEAEKLLRDLLDSRAYGAFAHAQLVELLSSQTQYEQALALLHEAKKRGHPESNFYAYDLTVSLLTGDREGAARIALLARDLVSFEDRKVTEDTAQFSFIAALGLLITSTDPWEQAAREFLTTEHEYVPYIAMMLHSRLADASGDAQKVIERYWGLARPDTWAARLREGDEKALREMLIGYYMKKVSRNDIFDDLEDEARYRNGRFRYLPFSRQALLCEAYFYDALLAEKDNDLARMTSSLAKTLETDYRIYWEYAMARFLTLQGDNHRPAAVETEYVD